MININSLILNTDGYKPSQYPQYPPNTTSIFSYVESRGGDYDYTEVLGMQMFLKEYLSKPITQDDIEQADAFLTAAGAPFNREGWQYILDTYDGYMPVVIKSVPEGMVIPTLNVIATIENTDPKCFWLTSYLETALLRAIWYPTTVATVSKSIKNIIADYLERTGTPEDIGFKLNDFGARGVSSFESSGIGGLAHLVNFMGSDNLTGSLFAMKYYDATGPVGFTIPATEHSTMTSWGKENEFEAYRNMLKQFGKEGAMLAVVSDSYDMINACNEGWGKELKQEVIDSGAVVIIRPDSGDPVTVMQDVMKALLDKFGYIVNEKGYSVLNNVRVIQGDGVNETTIRAMLTVFEMNRWSTDNIAFGMGGALLQASDRDTLKFAMKASSAIVNGGVRDVFKEPLTDMGKKSKRGRLTLVQDDFGNYRTVRESEVGDQVEVLQEVFKNGIITKTYTFDEVRSNSNK